MSFQINLESQNFWSLRFHWTTGKEPFYVFLSCFIFLIFLHPKVSPQPLFFLLNETSPWLTIIIQIFILGELCLPQPSHLTLVHYPEVKNILVDHTNLFFTYQTYALVYDAAVIRVCIRAPPRFFWNFTTETIWAHMLHKVADAKRVEGEKNKMLNVPLPSAWCPFRSSNATSGSACHSSWPVCSFGCPSDEPPESTQDTDTKN